MLANRSGRAGRSSHSRRLVPHPTRNATATMPSMSPPQRSHGLGSMALCSESSRYRRCVPTDECKLRTQARRGACLASRSNLRRTSPNIAAKAMEIAPPRISDRSCRAGSIWRSSAANDPKFLRTTAGSPRDAMSMRFFLRRHAVHLFTIERQGSRSLIFGARLWPAYGHL